MTHKKIPDILKEPAPCDDCEFWRRCRNEQLSCKAFGAYLELDDWSTAPRRPFAAEYKRQGLHIGEI